MLRLLVLSVFPSSVWAARVSRNRGSKSGEKRTSGAADGLIVPGNDFEPVWKALAELPSAGDVLGDAASAYTSLLALDNPGREDFDDIAKGFVGAVLTSAAPVLMTVLSLVKALVLNARGSNSGTKDSSAVVARAILAEAKHMIRAELLNHELGKANVEFIYFTTTLASLDMSNPYGILLDAQSHRSAIFGTCLWDRAHDSQEQLCRDWRTVRGSETFLLEVLYSDIEMSILTEGLMRSSNKDTWKSNAQKWGAILTDLLHQHALAFKGYRVDNTSMFTEFEADIDYTAQYITTTNYRAGKDVHLDQAITCGQNCLPDGTKVECHMQGTGQLQSCEEVRMGWAASWKSCLDHYKRDFVSEEYKIEFFNKYSKYCDSFPHKCPDWVG